jgi:hypothetical protein
MPDGASIFFREAKPSYRPWARLLVSHSLRLAHRRFYGMFLSCCYIFIASSGLRVYRGRPAAMFFDD